MLKYRNLPSVLKVTTQCVSLTDPNDRQIEPNVVVENILNYNAKNFSANSKTLVCVDCSMEECQDESSSKGVLLDVHYI